MSGWIATLIDFTHAAHRGRALHRQARAWLRANPAQQDRIAAGCLYRLNRYVKQARLPADSAHLQAVYAVKHAVMDHFTRQGYELDRRIHRRVRRCWPCGGRGRDATGQRCWKCGGSGVYAVHVFTYRIYRIAGRAYGWHVPWPPHARHPAPAQAPIAPFPAAGRAHNPAPASLDYLVLRQYLLDRGFDAPPDVGPPARDARARRWDESPFRETRRP